MVNEWACYFGPRLSNLVIKICRPCLLTMPGDTEFAWGWAQFMSKRVKSARGRCHLPLAFSSMAGSEEKATGRGGYATWKDLEGWQAAEMSTTELPPRDTCPRARTGPAPCRRAAPHCSHAALGRFLRNDPRWLFPSSGPPSQRADCLVALMKRGVTSTIFQGTGAHWGFALFFLFKESRLCVCVREGERHLFHS